MMRAASLYGRVRGGVTTVRVLFRPSGSADAVRVVTCTHANRVVFAARIGNAQPADPSFEFRFRGAKAGDRIALDWTDAAGRAHSVHGTVV
jgi:Sulphur oxidation protein SoxZ